jgi:SAM-dependent MidA family methyltransferase
LSELGLNPPDKGSRGVSHHELRSTSEIFFISNELFDCFPVDQFVLTESGWRERMIADKNFTLAPFDKKTHDFVEKEIATLAPMGAVFEYSFAARNFMSQLCEALRLQGGIAISIDYGYIKNEFVNTLQAVKNHQKVDVLENPGEADITTLVDFASLQKIATNSGLDSSLISQKEFLIGLGIEERRRILIKKNPQKKSEINSAIDRLIDSNQMGDLFKCLIVWTPS